MATKSIWLYAFHFKVYSGERHIFESDFRCLAANEAAAWAQVAAGTGGHNPPIHTIKLIDKEWLANVDDDRALAVLRETRNN